MTVVVTGSRGFVGVRLCSRLRAQGDTVIECDVQCGMDTQDWRAVSALPPCDVVVHLAARTFVPEAFSDPRTFYHVNVVSTLNMLEFCRMRGARMVFMSSYVYGVPLTLPIAETHPRRAHNPYAQSKIICEDLCAAYHRDFAVPAIMLRPFNIYGAGQRSEFLIPSIIGQARTGAVELKDPRPKRDYVHVDDVVTALAAAALRVHASCLAFNIGSGVSHSVEEVVAIVSRCCGGNVRTTYSGEMRPQEVLDTIADIRKAKTELQWNPSVTLEEGIRGMMAHSEKMNGLQE